MSPTLGLLSLSNNGSHVVPLLVVFHTPPVAGPTYTIFGLLSTTAISSIRPPITAGPISRNSKFFNLSVGLDWPAAPPAAMLDSPMQNTAAAKHISKPARARRILVPLSVQGRASYLLNAADC